jgi:hypothetical protein
MARGVAYNLGLRDGASLVAGGFDPRTRKVTPVSTPDLMASGTWATAGTFQALFNAKAAAPAAPGPAEYLIIGGTVSPDGSVAQLDPGYRVISAFPGAPSDAAGTHCLRFGDSAAADYCFSPLFLDPANATVTGGFEVRRRFRRARRGWR